MRESTEQQQENEIVMKKFPSSHKTDSAMLWRPWFCARGDQDDPNASAIARMRLSGDTWLCSGQARHESVQERASVLH